MRGGAGVNGSSCRCAAGAAGSTLEVMTTTDSPTTTTTPLEVVQTLYGAFGAGDVAAMLELIDPDVDWSLDVAAPGAELVPMFGNGRGHEAVARYFGGVADLEFHTFAPVRFLTDGDVVLVELELDVSHRGTGKRARFGEVHRFDVRDGRIVRYRPFLDTATLIELHRP